MSRTKDPNSFKQKCINNGVSPDIAYNYRIKHLELTDDQIIEYCRQKIK